MALDGESLRLTASRWGVERKKVDKRGNPGFPGGQPRTEVVTTDTDNVEVQWCQQRSGSRRSNNVSWRRKHLCTWNVPVRVHALARGYGHEPGGFCKHGLACRTMQCKASHGHVVESAGHEVPRVDDARISDVACC